MRVRMSASGARCMHIPPCCVNKQRNNTTRGRVPPRRVEKQINNTRDELCQGPVIAGTSQYVYKKRGKCRHTLCTRGPSCCLYCHTWWAGGMALHIRLLSKSESKWKEEGRCWQLAIRFRLAAKNPHRHDGGHLPSSSRRNPYRVETTHSDTSLDGVGDS